MSEVDAWNVHNRLTDWISAMGPTDELVFQRDRNISITWQVMCCTETRITQFPRRIRMSIEGRYRTFTIKQRARRKARHQQYADLGAPSGIIIGLGCQRSGTTFFENIFRHDLDSVVYGEYSSLSIGAKRTYLRTFEEIKAIIGDENASYAVMKPLFYSDRALEFLEHFPNSIVVWMFRDCPHVVRSMKNKWQGDFFETTRERKSRRMGVGISESSSTRSGPRRDRMRRGRGWTTNTPGTGWRGTGYRMS